MPFPATGAGSRAVREDTALVLRYGLAGVLNTLVGLGIISGLDLLLHAPPALANAAGYAVGVATSYALNRLFVFRDQTRSAGTGHRYVAVVAAGFLANQLVLQLGLRILGPGGLQHEAAQLASMGAYTVIVFIACRLWVFRPSPATGDDGI